MQLDPVRIIVFTVAVPMDAPGANRRDMQAKLLAKIEELTLRQIAQEERLDTQAARIAQLEAENAALRKSQP